MEIRVAKVSEPSLLDAAFAVRREVFVVEQAVPLEEEFDAFEDESFHFLALAGEEPCGAARWRQTKEGVKFERIAVLKAYRRMGIGKALMEALFEDIAKAGVKGKYYLHAQIEAMPLYASFGFAPVGERFLECDIVHQTMEYHS